MQPAQNGRATAPRLGMLVGLASAAGSAGGLGFVVGEPWNWSEFAIRLVVTLVAWSLLFAFLVRWEPRSPVTRRRLRVRRVVAEFRATGRHEEGLDPVGWLPALDDRRRELAAAAVFVAVLGVVLTVLVIGAAVRTAPSDIGIWAVAAAVVLVFARAAHSVREEGLAAGRLAGLLEAGRPHGRT